MSSVVDATIQRCAYCGRYLSTQAPDSVNEFTPDSEFTTESTVWFHKNCKAHSTYPVRYSNLKIYHMESTADELKRLLEWYGCRVEIQYQSIPINVDPFVEHQYGVRLSYKYDHELDLAQRVVKNFENGVRMSQVTVKSWEEREMELW